MVQYSSEFHSLLYQSLHIVFLYVILAHVKAGGMLKVGTMWHNTLLQLLTIGILLVVFSFP